MVVDKILPNLYLTDWVSASRLKREPDMVFIAVAPPASGIEEQMHLERGMNPSYKPDYVFPAVDADEPLIALSQKNLKYIEDAAKQIAKSLGEGKKVIVHCHQGVSRSPLAVIKYLMDSRGIDFDEAQEIVEKGEVGWEGGRGQLFLNPAIAKAFRRYKHPSKVRFT